MGGDGFPPMSSDGSVVPKAVRRKGGGEESSGTGGVRSGGGRLKNSKHCEEGKQAQHAGERARPLTPPARLEGRGGPLPSDQLSKHSKVENGISPEVEEAKRDEQSRR